MIKKIDNGYLLDVSLGIDPITKKQRRKRVKIGTKKEAQYLETKFLKLYHENKMTTQLDISLIDIFDIYEEKYTHNLKPSYKITQKRLFENYVKHILITCH
ncbi:TPA: hypothetical protein ACSPFR_000679 [Enterococcus faecium]|nr:hypothetical protein [Enterococcus faecium]